jgi:hypothetical protein
MGRYYVGSRRLRTIMAMPAGLDGPTIPYLPPEVVPFPRGFAFAPDGRIFLAPGMSPSGMGENTIKVFDAEGRPFQAGTPILRLMVSRGHYR